MIVFQLVQGLFLKLEKLKLVKIKKFKKMIVLKFKILISAKNLEQESSVRYSQLNIKKLDLYVQLNELINKILIKNY